MSVSLCVSPDTNCPCARCYEKVEYEKELWTILPSFNVLVLPKAGTLLIVLRRPSSHYTSPSNSVTGLISDCSSEIFLCQHSRGPFEGWHNVDLFAIPTLHCPSQDVEPPGSALALERSQWLCVPTTKIFAYYSRYILQHSVR